MKVAASCNLFKACKVYLSAFQMVPMPVLTPWHPADRQEQMNMSGNGCGFFHGLVRVSWVMVRVRVSLELG